MTQNCLLAAAFALTAPLAHRLGSLRPAGRQRRECMLADLVEDPAILLGMRCCAGDRHNLERLLETVVPRAAGGPPPTDSPDRGPAFFH
jgi:hypothetical protein